ncbi:hypothetical protein BaRGS_00037636, partial [Batillaria attramentaria]
SSWLYAAMLLANDAIGAGLLHFPKAFRDAGGVMISVVVQMVLMVFIVLAFFILVYGSDVNNSATYQDTIHAVCGKGAWVACSGCIFLYCFGLSLTLLIIIGDQWQQFFQFLECVRCHEEQGPLYTRRWFTITVSSVLCILPLIFPRRIDFLKYASVIGVFSSICVVGLITAQYFLPEQWTEIFRVVPDICFSYQCHIAAVPIYSCMEKRNMVEYCKTIGLCMSVCVFIYTVTATLGYLTFGDRVTSDILLSYRPDVVVLIAVIFTAVKSYTTYPIFLFCGRTALDSLWFSLRGSTSESETEFQERLRRVSVSSLWFFITLLLAVFIPDLGVVIQMLGSLAAVFIFVFPGMCLLRMAEGQGCWTLRTYVIVSMSVVFISLGAFMFGLTLTQSLVTSF